MSSSRASEPAVSLCEHCAEQVWPGRSLRRRARGLLFGDLRLASWDPRYHLGPVNYGPGVRLCQTVQIGRASCRERV